MKIFVLILGFVLLVASQILQVFLVFDLWYVTLALAAVMFVVGIIFLFKSKLFTRILAAILMAICAFLFVPNIFVATLQPSENPGYVIHAGGTEKGEKKYLNCQESFLTYLDQQLIEVDFLLTRDNYIVCSHMFEHLDGFNLENRPSLEEFSNTLLEGKYHGMTFAWLVDRLIENPSIRIVFDTKEEDLGILSNMIAYAKQKDFDIFSRFIIQVYSKEDYDFVKARYPFKEYWFTNYKVHYMPNKIQQYFGKCDDVSTYVLWMADWWVFTSSHTQTSKDIAVHTVNEEYNHKFLFSKGVDWIYVDYI